MGFNEDNVTLSTEIKLKANLELIRQEVRSLATIAQDLALSLREVIEDAKFDEQHRDLAVTQRANDLLKRLGL